LGDDRHTDSGLDDADRRKLGALHAALGTDPVIIGHYFSSPGRHPGNLAEELRKLGFEPVVDEEVTGDGLWHVAAFRLDALTESALSDLKAAMSQVAGRHKATYDGWEWRVTVDLMRRYPRTKGNDHLLP
jgi:hypothetical protein